MALVSGLWSLLARDARTLDPIDKLSWLKAACKQPNKALSPFPSPSRKLGAKFGDRARESRGGVWITPHGMPAKRPFLAVPAYCKLL